MADECKWVFDSAVWQLLKTVPAIESHITNVADEIVALVHIIFICKADDNGVNPQCPIPVDWKVNDGYLLKYTLNGNGFTLECRIDDKADKIHLHLRNDLPGSKLSKVKFDLNRPFDFNATFTKFKKQLYNPAMAACGRTTVDERSILDICWNRIREGFKNRICGTAIVLKSLINDFKYKFKTEKLKAKLKKIIKK